MDLVLQSVSDDHVILKRSRHDKRKFCHGCSKQGWGGDNVQNKVFYDCFSNAFDIHGPGCLLVLTGYGWCVGSGCKARGMAVEDSDRWGSGLQYHFRQSFGSVAAAAPLGECSDSILVILVIPYSIKTKDCDCKKHKILALKREGG